MPHHLHKDAELPRLRKLSDGIGKEGVEFRYNDVVELPFPTARKVAETLHGGSPCVYESDPTLDKTTMKTFVLSRVIPKYQESTP
jgi:hypothetical protein